MEAVAELYFKDFFFSFCKNELIYEFVFTLSSKINSELIFTLKSFHFSLFCHFNNQTYKLVILIKLNIVFFFLNIFERIWSLSDECGVQ